MTTNKETALTRPSETALSLRDRLLLVGKEEWAPLAWSFMYFFFLLCGYYILRPVRDDMGIAAGVHNMSKLFTAVFVVMLLLTPVFGWLLAKFPRRQLLPAVYLFFASHLFLFWLLFSTGQHVQSATVAFFVWVSVFNLFAVSVFWSFMADLWATEEARRLYGFIAAGGTAGAIAGPLVTAVLVSSIGTRNLLLLSMACLLVCVVCIFRLNLWAMGRSQVAPPQLEIGPRPGIFEGIRLLSSSPYLLAICGFVVLYSTTSTFLYLQQAEVVANTLPTSAERTALFAKIDLAVNLLTLGIQLFLLQPLLSRLGLVVALLFLPVVSAVGFLALGFHPTLATLLVVVIARRASEFAIAKPSRETLFNVLGPTEKYQAKNFMDTVVYRGGDMTSSWLQNALKSAGVGLVGIAFLAAPLCAVWAGLGVYLGSLHRRIKDVAT